MRSAKGSLFSSRRQIGSAPCAGISYPVSPKSQECYSTSFRSANKLGRELRRPLWKP